MTKKNVLCAIAVTILVLLMSVDVTFGNDVWQDPYGYWISTNETPEQLQERQQILNDYYANYMTSPPKRQPTTVEINIEDEYYMNYLEEVKIRIR